MDGKTRRLLRTIATAEAGSCAMLDAVERLMDLDPAACDRALTEREAELCVAPRRTTVVEWGGARGKEE